MGWNPIIRAKAAATAPTAPLATRSTVTSPFTGYQTDWGTMAAANEAAALERQRALAMAEAALATPTLTPTRDIRQSSLVTGGTPTGGTPTGGQQIAASGTGVTGGDVWDSFARRYVPGTWDWTTGGGTVLRDWLNRSGDAGSRTRGNLGLEAALGPLADNALFIFNLLNSGNPDISDMGDDDIINWMANQLLPGASTPGGRFLTTDQLLNSLYGGLSKDSYLYDTLFTNPSTGDPLPLEDQIGNVMNYFNTAAQFSNPLFGSAMSGRAQRLANEYRDQQAKGNFTDDTFLEYLKEEIGLR